MWLTKFKRWMWILLFTIFSYVFLILPSDLLLALPLHLKENARKYFNPFFIIQTRSCNTHTQTHSFATIKEPCVFGRRFPSIVVDRFVLFHHKMRHIWCIEQFSEGVELYMRLKNVFRLIQSNIYETMCSVHNDSISKHCSKTVSSIIFLLLRFSPTHQTNVQ